MDINWKDIPGYEGYYQASYSFNVDYEKKYIPRWHLRKSARTVLSERIRDRLIKEEGKKNAAN